jgi:hypothetical protein
VWPACGPSVLSSSLSAGHDECLSRARQWPCFARLAFRVTRGVRAQLCVPRNEFEIDRRFEVVEVQLHLPKPRADVACDLLAEIPHAERAADQHTQQSAHEEDQHNHHGSRLNVGVSYQLVCTLLSAFVKVAISHMSICNFAN